MVKYIIIIFLLISCSTIYPHNYNLNCRNQALYCGLIASEQHEVKIAFGPVKDTTLLWHAQAKVKINNDWRWLYMTGQYCYFGEQDNFIALNELSIEDFIHYMRK